MALIRAYWSLMKRPGTQTLQYMPRPYIYSRIGRDQIVEAAQRNSQIPKAYLQQTFDALIVEVENFVMNGHSITLDNFGTIRSFLRGSGTPAAADYLIENNLQQVKFSFKPATKLNQLLRETEIRVTDIRKPYKPIENNG